MKVNELNLNAVYSYADYLTWANEERCELINGCIFPMSPAPTSLHQRISFILGGEFYAQLKDKRCMVFAAPFDVRFPKKSKNDKDIFTVLQPDLSVICDQTKIDKRGCIGAPDIVVEILSLGNNRKDLKNKYEVYEEAGVKEYWIIHPEEKTLFRYLLNEKGVFEPTRLLTSGDEVSSTILPGLVLNLNTIFEDEQLH